jgi:transcriptional regulator with XRE-family HTH domain
MSGRKGFRSTEELKFNALIGDLICKARKRRGVMAKELAQAAGVSRSQMYWYEVGRDRCPVFVLDIFARRLGVPFTDFLPMYRYGGFSGDSEGETTEN